MKRPSRNLKARRPGIFPGGQGYAGALTREFKEGVDEGEVSLAPPTLFPEQDAAVGNENEEQNEINEKRSRQENARAQTTLRTKVPSGVVQCKVYRLGKNWDRDDGISNHREYEI